MKNEIVIDSEVLGGKPRVKGTRVSVDQIYEMYSIRGMTPGEIADVLPTVDEKGVKEALKYAEEHGLTGREGSSKKAVSRG